MSFSDAASVAVVVDGHAHLDAVSDVENSLKEAYEKGVVAVVGVGMDLSSNRTILELANRFPRRVYPAVGLHPWKVNARGLDEELEFVCQHLPEAIALGEVGLDYKMKDTKALQIEAFQILLREAARLDKPAITHSRFSHARTLQLLSESNVRRAVFHWYSGPDDVLDIR
ncbi:MAG: TatD family hydrolase [Deltaproteobacteria bacterium]|nr:TatD family hydrolase [Deltaproteobacteria bacterium]